MAKYVDAGYWVRGYAQGDYVDAALSADATSGAVTAAGFLSSTAAVPAATSTATFSPYRVQQTGIKSDGASTTDASAGLNLFVGNLIASDSAGLIAAAKTINKAGGAVSAEGIMALATRLKWEVEAEPGDTWTDELEPTGIWADSAEPGDTWTNTTEPDGIWTDRPEPGDTWSET